MGVLASDTFNRANNPDLGPDWDIISGLDNFKIQSNAAVPNNVGGADAGELNNTVVWPADQYSQATLSNVVGGGGGAGIGVGVRISGTSYYRCVVGGAGANNVQVEVRPGGSTIATRTQTFSDGDVLRMEIQGTTLRLYRNGVQMGADITDGTHASGSAGIVFSSTMTSGELTDWEGGDLAPPPSAGAPIAWIRA